MGSWQLTRHSAIASPPFPLLHTSVWAAAASRWGAEMDYCKKFAKYLQCSDCSRHLSWHVEQFDSVIWTDIASCTPAHAMTSGWYRSRLRKTERREVWRSAASQAILGPILVDNDIWAAEDGNIWQILRCLTLSEAPVTKYPGRMFLSSSGPGPGQVKVRWGSQLKRQNSFELDINASQACLTSFLLWESLF